MVMTRSTAVGSIVTGSIMLVFAVITVICGAISASKVSGSGQAAASAGLWSLYYALPGILCIVAGVTKNGVVMGFALFFNIIAVIVSAVASVLLIILTALLNEVVDRCQPDGSDKCTCYGTSDGYDTSDSNNSFTFDGDCSYIKTFQTVVIAIMVVYIMLTVTTFSASIFGCMGTCCAPVDPVVVVTAGVPVQTGGTVVVTSNQSHIHTSGYPAAMPPPGYGQALPPSQGYADNQGLVKNMAI